MNSEHERLLQKSAWLIFISIILFYGIMYAPYGLENNDTGFILGLAHQVFLGESFYDEIIYVRPPISPILHSFVFHKPFSAAPVLIDRLFVISQIATYSYLSVILAKKYFNWTSGFSGVVASLAFVFSYHSFPLMAWHTIDGIFFSILSIYFITLGINKHNFYLLIAACFSVMAAAAKQPFYLSPLIFLGLSLVLETKVRIFFIACASLFCAAVLFMIILGRFGSIDLFFNAISSQTSLGDLLNSGIHSYILDVTNLKSIAVTLPLFVVLGFLALSNNKKTIVQSALLISSIFLILFATAIHYLSSTSWNQPLSIYDSIFVTTFLCCTVMIWKTKNNSWVLIFALHIIAWSASISWGYQTAILYAAPSVITIAFFVERSIKTTWLIKTACIATLPISIAAFYIANEYYYSLEGPVRRASITEDMSTISPVLKLIKSTPEQYSLYAQLMEIINNLGDSTYVVLPNIPLAHAFQGKANPIGIDWPLNAEVGRDENKLKDRLNKRVEFAIVYINASPKPETEGMFGSRITQYVTANWRLVESTGKFSVFENTTYRTRNGGR